MYGEIEFDCNHHGVFENAIDMVGWDEQKAWSEVASIGKLKS